MAEDSELPEIIYPEWQREYEAALLELDPKKLKAQVMAAETAIFKRQQTISQNVVDEPERLAIQDALSSLRTLKEGCPGFSRLGTK